MADKTPRIEQEKIDLPLTRTPLTDLDVTDLAAVRAWALRAAEYRVRNEGRLRPCFRMLTVEKEEVIECGEPDPERDQHLAAFFHQLAMRPEVRHAFREGELFVEVEGSNRRAAVLLRVEPAADGQDAWWLAWRLIGERIGSVGVFHGDWTVREGAGVDELPEAFQEWLACPDIATVSDVNETPKDFDMPEILGAIMEAKEPTPATPQGVCELVGKLTDREILTQGLPGFYVLAFRPGTVEQFIVKGRPPCSVDDVIRNIAGMGPVDAVALVIASVANVDGVDTRAIVAIAERDGKRAQRVMPLKFGPDGKVEAPRCFGRLLPDPAPEKQWIGVKPETELEMFAMPEIGRAMPEG